MNEIQGIILTTIVCGVAAYVITKHIIDPIIEQKKLIGEIEDSLMFYANIYCNLGLQSKEKLDEASKKFRQLGTILQSKTHLIPLYNFFSKIRFVTKTSEIEKASKELIGLSNSIYTYSKDDPITNSDRADRIKKFLNLKIK